MVSLEDFRQQIDDVDQLIIQNLSQSGAKEDYLDTVTELTSEDKEMLRSTQLHFSQRVCDLLQRRMQISRDIGHVKNIEWRTSMIDEERKRKMIQSRVDWAPDELKPQVEILYHIIHDISVRVQNDTVGRW